MSRGVQKWSEAAIARLEREVTALKGRAGTPPEDEVLALIDGGGRTRA